MYNLVFGQNSFADDLLLMLGLTRQHFARFRDCYVSEGKIIVYTRLGGGNREEYEDVFDFMRKHPEYISNEDDDFDSTYCTFYFRVPAQFVELVKDQDIGKWEPSQRWQDAIDALKKASR